MGQDRDETRELTIGEIVLARFRVQGIIGRGGMGVVYGARDERDQRDVAIKILHDVSVVGVERFVREMRIASKIESEHVPRVFEVGSLRDRPLFVMERLRGRDLGARLATTGQLEVGDVADVVVQACEALAHAHAAGVVHRDVKVSNLFEHHEQDRDERTIVKVLDFGISRVVDAETSLTKTQDAGWLGSAPYMSPEHARDPRTVDARSDLWSLGVVAFRLLTKTFPFEGDRDAVLRAIRTQPPPSLASRGVIAPPEIEAAIAKCLRREREERFANAGELAAAFAPFTSERWRTLHERVIAIASRAPKTSPPIANETRTVDPPPPPPDQPAEDDASIRVAPAKRTIGRFVVESILGSGGMADVFAAYDPTLERRVALKILRGTKDEDVQRRRILREARAAAALTHPNTVTIFEVGESGEEVFIAMELLEGATLRNAATDASTERKVRWLLEAARALAAAHERGLVHRDVKPENMFVCRDGALKLLDFGIAKRDEADVPVSERTEVPASFRTVAGKRIGTPRYMAPEQRAALPSDARTDQYAWGLVAYELFTGEHASDAAHHAIPDLDGDANAAIERALSEKIDNRFASMAPIVTAFEHALAQISTGASTAPPVLARSSPPPPRRRWARYLLVAVALAAIGGAISITSKRGRVAVTPAIEPRLRLPTPCHVTSSRKITGRIPDQIAVVPTDDGMVVGFDAVAEGVLEVKGGSYREAHGTFETFEPLGDTAFHQPLVRGFSTPYAPALAIADFAPHGGSIAVWRSGVTLRDIARIDQTPSGGLDGTALGDGVMVVVASSNGEDGELHGLVFKSGLKRVLLVQGPEPIRNPSIALSRNGAGVVVFNRGTSIAAILINAGGDRVGDVMTIADEGGKPNAAWVGDTIVAAWGRDMPEPRIVMSALPPDATAFTKPIVLDEVSAPSRPFLVSPPDARPFLVYAATVGRKVSVRAATIGPEPSLDAPIEIGASTSVGRIATSSAPHGGFAAFVDDEITAVRVVRITCTP